MPMVLGWDYSQVCKYNLEHIASDLHEHVASLCYDQVNYGSGEGSSELVLRNGQNVHYRDTKYNIT